MVYVEDEYLFLRTGSVSYCDDDDDDDDVMDAIQFFQKTIRKTKGRKTSSANRGCVC